MKGTREKNLVVFALVLAACFAPAAAAKSAASFAGKWEGTFKMQRPDGTEGRPERRRVQPDAERRVITGTAGPAEKAWEIEKGAVNAGKATFEVQQPDGPLFKFTLTIVKGRLQGEMAGER